MREELASQAKEVLVQEAAAIQAAVARLDAAQLETAVNLLVNAKGKVVVVGTGKSGIAARKIAGTLTSYGTAAIFLHPVDALHGDLGVISSDDVAIAVSNSGETDEILALLVHLKKRAVPVIALVGEPTSTLGTQAEAILDASVENEVGPIGLAPTTSTTLAIVIGDALAILLMKARGFSEDDFALIHPAGQLGKRLTLTVGDLMHKGEANPTVSEDAPWMEVLANITKGGLGAVSVVAGRGELKGLISDGDVRRSMQNLGLDAIKTVSASQIMTVNPIVVSPDLLAYDALKIMENRPSQIAVLPVVDDQKRSVGLVRLHDIIRAGLK